MIVLKRQPYTKAVAEALEHLDFDAEALKPEVCEVLLGGMPTPEEAQLLLNYKGDPLMLRQTERLLLPIARLERPPAGQRLRLALFGRMMAELSSDALDGLSAVRRALDDARNSDAFRDVLSHTARLGSIINFGVARTDGEVTGFALDALPRLALFKSASNARITLMHVLVAQVTAVDQELPARLLQETGSVHRGAQRCIAPLADDVNAFAREADHVAKCKASCASNAALECDDAASRLTALADRATADARSLKEELSATREAANTTLQFFALHAKPHEVDAKALELLTLLSDFVNSFDACRQELLKNPQLAAACHRGALSLIHI